MSSIDLNVVQRGLNGQKWTAEKGPITAGDLDKITELRTDNSSALNAVPTPFARFFVVKEAFRRVLEEAKNPSKTAGEAYNRLVSDTLDVFEILYDLSYFENRWGDSRKLVIKEWDANNLAELNRSVPKLGNAVANYMQSDLKGLNGVIYFVVLQDSGHNYLLGASSPFTGFVTPPDLDKKVGSKVGESTFMGEVYRKMPVIMRKTNGTGAYFKDVRMFGNRDKGFKNFMFNLIDNSQLGSDMKELRDYIKEIAKNDTEIKNDWEPSTLPIYSDGKNEVVVNGLPIRRDNGISTVNFFNDTLVRLPFRLSSGYYKTMEYQGDRGDRRHDYLMPLSKESLLKLDENFVCKCKETPTKVTITLKYGGQEYTKDYYFNDAIGNRGRIVDLGNEGIDFNLGVFPNVLSPNASENNYFKVMAVMSDSLDESTGFKRVSIDDFDIAFMRKNDAENYEEIGVVDRNNKSVKFGAYSAVVRSSQNELNNVDAGSKFFEVYNTHFDAMSLSFKLQSGTCDGILFPNWRRSMRTDDSYVYAIDLGTTNTYISCCKYGSDIEPEQLNMKVPMIAYLHESKRSSQHSFVSIIENALAPAVKKNFRTEFLPAMIDGVEYKFPIRTALCVKKDDHAKPSLFDNANIAFFYEKSRSQGNQLILTDIKWEDKNRDALSLFIKELLLIIKEDVLQRNGQLAKTKLVWFRPLSFAGSIREFYNQKWLATAKEVLNIDADAIECVSESEAPYYYFNKTNNTFKNVDAVSIVDIGGGSSDFIYFEDGTPQIANSVHFGCDMLWGNGFNGFSNSRENGIFKKYESTVHLGGHDDELEILNRQMCSNREVSTKDIINMWLSNDSKSEITSKLRQDYKPLFLYHFASIVFFMAKMYKAKNLPCPSSVLFCGNGSKYIDGLLSSDKNIIEEIVNVIFKYVYGGDKEVQVVLPSSRKECTCYGGLYRPVGAAVPKEFNYQGVEKEYENVGELSKEFPAVCSEVLSTLSSFHRLYENLLDLLISKGELGTGFKKAPVINAISANLKDAVEKNFKTQVKDRLSESEKYHDSVFFLPVVDNVLKLTKI